MKLPSFFVLPLLLAPLPLGAATPSATSDVFARFDRNGDGKVTPDELANPRADYRYPHGEAAPC
jgi:hypothetical protein